METVLVIVAIAATLVAGVCIGLLAGATRTRRWCPGLSEASAAETLHDSGEDEEEADDAPRPVDVNNPPRLMTYNPKRPSTIVCTCHGDRLVPGDQVMLWPIPSHPDGALDIFCQRTIQEAQS